MNKIQRMIILLGLLIIIAMGLFPPWYHTIALGGQRTFGYYHWLFYEPPQGDAFGVRIDKVLLSAQWFVVALVVSILAFLAKNRKG